jgi:hypothetical protein
LLYTFFSFGARWVSVINAGRFTLGKETGYLSYRRLGGLQNPSGQLGEYLAITGILFPGGPAGTESLYQVRYPDPHLNPHLSDYSALQPMKP